jgi:hypothetical protein
LPRDYKQTTTVRAKEFMKELEEHWGAEEQKDQEAALKRREKKKAELLKQAKMLLKNT